MIAAKAVPLDAFEEREQDRAIGRDIEREGAAESHVVFGHAAPNRRRHHDRDVPRRLLRRGAAHALRQDGIDADRQVRTVLFDRADRQDHDRVGGRLRAQFLRGQLLPHYAFSHRHILHRHPEERATSPRSPSG